MSHFPTISGGQVVWIIIMSPRLHTSAVFVHTTILIVLKKYVLYSSQLARRINPWSHLGLRTISIIECQQREKHVEGGSSLFIKMPFKLTFYTLTRWIMRWGNRREFRWFIKTFALKSIYLVCHYYTRVDYSFPTNPVVIFHSVILF